MRVSSVRARTAPGTASGSGSPSRFVGRSSASRSRVRIVARDANPDPNPTRVSTPGDAMPPTIDWSVVDFDADVGHAHWTRARRRETGARVRRALEAAAETRRAGRMATYDESGDEEESMERMSVEFAAEALIASGTYDADARAGLRTRATRAGESWRTFAEAEDGAAERMRRAAALDDGSESESEERAEGAWSWTRAVKIGGAAAIGGAALFVTGGVAAPAVLASLSGLGVIGAATTGVLATLGGVGAVFGATGAGLTGYAMLRRTSTEMEQFQFIPLRGVGRRFALHVFVPGFLRDERDLLRAWGAEKNQYVVVIDDPGELGMTLERDDDGYLIVQTTDALKQTVKGAASLAGVISGSILVSYRSIDPQELARSRSSKILSKKGKTPKIEELEAMPRPLELRLQLTKDEALDKKMDSLVEKMREVVLEKTIDEKDAEAPAAKPEWGNHTGEQYVLNWEPSTLTELGTAMQFVGGKYAITVAAPKVLARTALASITTAVSWPVTLLSCACYLDNPWTIARAKAEIAGEEIANALLTQQHGRRPVTFVTYSSGAFVVQSALMKLHAAGEKGKNIVERVVFISAPMSTSNKVWEPMREVVSGRLVNVYVPDDWMLLFFYRLKSVDTTLGLAGLQRVDRDDVENFEMSFKHANIPDEMSRILNEINLDE